MTGHELPSSPSDFQLSVAGSGSDMWGGGNEISLFHLPLTLFLSWLRFLFSVYFISWFVYILFIGFMWDSLKVISFKSNGLSHFNKTLDHLVIDCETLTCSSLSSKSTLNMISPRWSPSKTFRMFLFVSMPWLYLLLVTAPSFPPHSPLFI